MPVEREWQKMQIGQLIERLQQIQNEDPEADVYVLPMRHDCLLLQAQSGEQVMPIVAFSRFGTGEVV